MKTTSDNQKYEMAVVDDGVKLTITPEGAFVSVWAVWTREQWEQINDRMVELFNIWER